MPPAPRPPAILAAVFGLLLGSGASAQVAAPLNPATLKGTNYVCATSTAIDNCLAMLPYANLSSNAYGSYVPEAMVGEIEKLAALGLNSIRLFSSLHAYLIDRDAFLVTLKDLATACRLNGIRITYVVWSAIGATGSIVSRDGVPSTEAWHDLVGTDPNAPRCYDLYLGVVARDQVFNAAAQSLGPLPPGEILFGSMHHDPGNELVALSGHPASWPHQMGVRVDRYLDEIATFFSTDPDGIAAFGSYDLFNEPNGGTDTYGVPLPNYLQFIQYTASRLRALHSGAPTTIGWAGAGPAVDNFDQLARAVGIGVTYHSVHSYAGPEVFRPDLAARKAYAASLGLPLVVSEFYRVDFNAGQLGQLLDAVQDLQVGGQMWGFFQGNVFSLYPGYGLSPIDGVVVPTLHPSAVSPVSFDTVNTGDLAAVEQWGAGTLSPPPYTALRVLAASSTPLTSLPVNAPLTLELSSSRAGDPVFLFVTGFSAGSGPCPQPGSSSCQIVPGVGFLVMTPATLSYSVGPMPASGLLSIPGIVLDAAWSGSSLAIQVYVGSGPTIPFTRHDGELTWFSTFPIL